MIAAISMQGPGGVVLPVRALHSGGAVFGRPGVECWTGPVVLPLLRALSLFGLAWAVSGAATFRSSPACTGESVVFMIGRWRDRRRVGRLSSVALVTGTWFLGDAVPAGSGGRLRTFPGRPPAGVRGGGGCGVIGCMMRCMVELLFFLVFICWTPMWGNGNCALSLHFVFVSKCFHRCRRREALELEGVRGVMGCFAFCAMTARWGC